VADALASMAVSSRTKRRNAGKAHGKAVTALHGRLLQHLEPRKLQQSIDQFCWRGPWESVPAEIAEIRGLVARESRLPLTPPSPGETMVQGSFDATCPLFYPSNVMGRAP